MADTTLTYTYDGLSKLSEEFVVAGTGFTETLLKTYYTYPPLALATRAISGYANSAFTYCYDADGAAVGIATGSSSCGGPQFTVQRGAPPAGNGMVSGATVGAGITESNTYDLYGLLKEYKVVSTSAGTVYDVMYTRVGSGDERVYTKNETIKGVNCVSTYTYDSSNRLASIAVTGSGCPASASFSYNADGGFTAYSYDNQDRILNLTVQPHNQYSCHPRTARYLVGRFLGARSAHIIMTSLGTCGRATCPTMARRTPTRLMEGIDASYD